MEIQEVKQIIVKEDLEERLDNFVLSYLEDKSRSKIKHYIDEGLLTVNGNKKKAGYKPRKRDVIEIKIPVEQTLNANPENIPLDIVYEDDDLCVINKPQGMVVHPAVGNYSGTLVNALCYRVKNLSSINGSFRPGIVHRLDKNTSGLMLVAKNDFAHEILAKSIQNKTTKRFYKAILIGKLKQEEGQIVTNIARSLKDGKKMEVCDSSRGKVAITNYKVLEYYGGFSLVEFELKTGRTHQIRVHAKYLGHPVVGDDVYGYGNEKFGLEGQLLHSYKIIFNHPRTGQIMQFKTELPSQFQKFLDKFCK